MGTSLGTLVGTPHPLGATPDARGTNFALFSQHATSVELLLFEAHDSVEPMQVIRLDPNIHRTFYFWHVYVEGARPGIGYGYRVDGPRDVSGAGHRYDPEKLLIDPSLRWGPGDPRRVDGSTGGPPPPVRSP